MNATNNTPEAYRRAEQLAFGPDRSGALSALLDDGEHELLAWAERGARRVLNRRGYALRKSRTRIECAADFGTYKIILAVTNTVEAGEPHGLTLAEVLDFTDPGF